MLRAALTTSAPFAVSRHGSNELCYVSSRSANTFRELCGIAGFFPADQALGERFIREYCAACEPIDLLAVWNFRHCRFELEEQIFSRYSPDARLIDLDSLTPFLFPAPWSSALAGKRVVVVHPFADSIIRQYETKRELLFPDSAVLPPFRKFTVIKAVQSMGGCASGFTTWFDALAHMQEQLKRADFDVALIGCGAYGLPLASFVKRMGRQAVHIGGALQLLFGIKGKRWEANGYDYHLKYYNEHWIRPGEEDAPRNKERFEGGCYW